MNIGYRKTEKFDIGTPLIFIIGQNICQKLHHSFQVYECIMIIEFYFYFREQITSAAANTIKGTGQGPQGWVQVHHPVFTGNCMNNILKTTSIITE